MTSEPQPVRRRSMLGISGWMLVVCLFLPTLRVCDDPVMPIQFPPTYGVYLGGLVIGIIAFKTLLPPRRGGLVFLIALWLATAFTYAALYIGAVGGEGFGFASGTIFLVLLILIIRRAIKVPWTDRGVAIGCLIHAVIALGWSALLAFDPDGMWGATVSLFAASLMLVASVGYIATAPGKPPDATELPAARVV